MEASQRQAIESACRKVVLCAARCADAGDAAGLARLFALEGVLERPNSPAVLGRDAIEQSYAQRPANRITRHLVTNTLVEIESAVRACASSYVLLWAGTTDDAEGPMGRPAHGLQLVGEFLDQFVLEEDSWRIANRRARFVLHV